MATSGEENKKGDLPGEAGHKAAPDAAFLPGKKPGFWPQGFGLGSIVCGLLGLLLPEFVALLNLPAVFKRGAVVLALAAVLLGVCGLLVETNPLIFTSATII
jgi:hypothetical protein